MGPAPTEEAEAAHTCGNGHLGCINPRHLEWKMRKGNAEDMVRHGRSQRGERHYAAKLRQDDIPYIRSNPDGLSRTQLANKFGCTKLNILAVQKRKSWAWVPDAFAAEHIDEVAA